MDDAYGLPEPITGADNAEPVAGPSNGATGFMPVQEESIETRQVKWITSR